MVRHVWTTQKMQPFSQQIIHILFHNHKFNFLGCFLFQLFLLDCPCVPLSPWLWLISLLITTFSLFLEQKNISSSFLCHHFLSVCLSLSLSLSLSVYLPVYPSVRCVSVSFFTLPNILSLCPQFHCIFIFYEHLYLSNVFKLIESFST